MSYLKFYFFLSLSVFSFASTEQKNVSLQLQWHDQFQFAGYYIAKEKGFYKDVGLNVDIKKFKKNIDTTDEVVNNNSDFGIGRSTLIIDKSRNKDIVLLNAIFQTSPLVLLSLKSSNINNITDFKNKKIMIDKKQTVTISIQAMLKSANISFDDMKIYNRTYDINDLISKKVDLMPAYLSDKAYALDRLGIKYNVFDPKDFGFDFYEDILFTSQKMIDNHPKTVSDFQKATIKGWKYAFANIEQSVDLIMKKYNSQNKTKEALLYEANSLKKIAYYENNDLGNIDINKLKRIYLSYNLLGFIDTHSNNIGNLLYSPNEYDLKLSKKEKKYLKEKKSIKICIDPNWMPFEKIDKDGNHIGISSEYFKKFQKELGIPIELVKTKSWTETLESAKNRKCDILTLGNETPARKEYLNFTAPYLRIPLVLVTKNDVSYIDNVKYIKNKKIGVVKNSALIEIIKIKYPNFIIVEVKNNKDGLLKVQNNQLFAYVGNMLSVGYILQKEYIKDLKIINKLGDESSNLAVGIRNDDNILFSIFSKLIENISNDTKQNILNKYLSIKYEKTVNYKYITETIVAIILIILIFGFIQYKLKQINNKLESKVREKTNELKLINDSLESRINEEVHKNSQKDKILAQQSKMVAMGEMLENIAHQWRQPLSVISTSATGMIMQKELNVSTYDMEMKSYETINDTAQHLSKTIDDFRNFFKPNKDLQYHNLKNIYKSTLNIMNSAFMNSKIKLIENINDVEVLCLDGELSQVIMNLLNNAKDILEEKNIENKYIFIDVIKEDNKAIIKIKDNGGGIPLDFIDKIFEPYFTTKHKSQGTGIGLYMSQEIISRHLKGNIYVNNKSFIFEEKEYKGAEFEITLLIS